jgi:anaerobic magnesium-protoporphyrin IX monomethyl ester cyclase
MDIVLIDPPTSHEQIYGDWDLSKVDTYCPPLGLLYIASFVRSHGHTVHVLDLTARNWSLAQAVDFIQSIKPGIVGISAKTINIHNAAVLADEIKETGADYPVVVGGAHMTAVPAETMEKFPSIDAGVIGEGELTFMELVERTEQKSSFSDVLGVVYRDGFGHLVINPPRPVIDNLDELPLPAWDLLPGFPGGYKHSALETKRFPSASIITSRGCPYSCTFCDNAVFGTRVRHHSAEYTVSMIRHLTKAHGVRDLMILDDNFLLKRDKVHQICDSLIAEGDDLSWYCIGHAKFMTEDRMQKIRDAGCWFIELGIESGCDRILKVIKKNTTKREIAAAVQTARNAGLKVKGNFIFGLPTETKESLNESIQFAKSIGLTHFQQNFLTVWPGCEISVDPGRFGEFSGNWKNMAHQRITFVPCGLTEKDLIEASRKAFREFYIRPRIIFETLKGTTSLRAAVSLWTAFGVFVSTVIRRAPKRHLSGVRLREESISPSRPNVDSSQQYKHPTG